ncbi:endonuclease [Comamonas serinivorans]|uniref:Endonuclease n=1 Tax=Comamonas serinivorans TaxID=1082851 RepID=A0A1Y0EKT6_9BURK|nr:GIY-YIG nuclease family protein [Comamonas serinivorans]ARU04061.1 endonuclease [Comamonas serinivorans]
MSIGRSIRLFLVDGSSNGLLTAEIMNWTGHVLTGPRSKLAEVVRRPECARTGIYFLIGPDPDNALLTRVYIGESDDVAERLKQHNRPETPDGRGGKDFWERVCLVTSKDMNLTKAHAKYLESKLIGIATAAGRCVVSNGTAHDYGALPESDRADMAYFLDQIRTVLPVLGFDFLHEARRAPSTLPVPPVADAQGFEMSVPRHGIQAFAKEVDGEFVVQQGSRARGSWIGGISGYQGLFEQLVASGILQADGADHCRFAEDHAFSSPSAAASVVCGRIANGRTSWLVQGSLQTYADWQDAQLKADGAPAE